jgi:site-specific DNA-methyltransferase (adenine-specific)
MQLFHGDCLEVMKTLPDQSVDLILTDPPYGTTQCKWDSIIPFEPMWKELKRIIKDNGCIALFGSEPFSSALRMSNIKNFKYDWIWNKKKGGNPLLSKIQPIKIFENIMIFGKKGKKVNYYPIMEKRNKIKYRGKNKGKQSELTKNSFTENKSYTHKYPKAILEISNASQTRKLHPTQKPVALLEYLIKTYTNENDIVLDFTMGSGSTGVAAKNLNREFIGIELDQEYYKISKNRIEAKDLLI